MDKQAQESIVLTIGSFHARLTGGDLSSKETFGLLFEPPTPEGMTKLGQFICHATTAMKEVSHVKYAMYKCSHVRTGIALAMSADLTPWGSIMRCVGIVSDKHEQLAEAIEKMEASYTPNQL